MALLSLGEGSMAKTQYGIKIPLAVDDYIWVTEMSDLSSFDLQPVLYNTVEEATAAAEIWGPLARVELYDKNNIIS